MKPSLINSGLFQIVSVKISSNCYMKIYDNCRMLIDKKIYSKCRMYVNCQQL